MSLQDDKTEVQHKPLKYADLTEAEKAIYDDLYINIPVKVIARNMGYIGESGRVRFHQQYGDIIALAHLEHQRDLRSAQWELAVTDKNPTMLIFLGKQVGQSDQVATPMGEGADEVQADPSVIKVVFPEDPRKAKEQP